MRRIVIVKKCLQGLHGSTEFEFALFSSAPMHCIALQKALRSFQSASSSFIVITMITMMIRNGMTFCMGSLASSSSNDVLQMAKQLKSRSTHFEQYIFEVDIIKV